MGWVKGFGWGRGARGLLRGRCAVWARGWGGGVRDERETGAHGATPPPIQSLPPSPPCARTGTRAHFLARSLAQSLARRRGESSASPVLDPGAFWRSTHKRDAQATDDAHMSMRATDPLPSPEPLPPPRFGKVRSFWVFCFLAGVLLGQRTTAGGLNMLPGV